MDTKSKKLMFGQLDEITDFPWPKQFTLTTKEKRRLWVWLPPLVGRNSNEKFDVIYMHDGQNVFLDEDATYGNCWKMIEAQQARYNAGKTCTAVVGIESQSDGFTRFKELSPWQNIRMDFWKGYEDVIAGGAGDAYLSLLVEEIIPFVEACYPVKTTPQARTLAGSSMGGLISIYAATKYEHLFHRYLAMSTASWFAQEQFEQCLKSHEFSDNTKIYNDIGTNETSHDSLSEFPDIYVRTNNQLAKILEEKLVLNNFHYRIEEGAIHSETAWSKRLPSALSWLLDS
jgi:predicted alpha/beta superfamily hydrolase